MATVNLTAGDDVFNLLIGLSGGLQGGTNSSQKSNVIDAGAGVDTLYVLDSYLSSNWKLTTSGDGIITITTASGFTSFKNFEKAQFGSTIINLGTAGNDTITGTAKADPILYGLAGDDSIDGGAGADSMYGGAGNDTYVVDNIKDVVTELAGAGTDTVFSSVAYTLGSEVENLTLTGTGAINGTGNALANVITGNSGANLITGGAGDDTLDGGAGTDTLVLSGASTDYTITYVSATQVTVVDHRTGGDGSDVVSNFENVQFSTGIVTLASVTTGIPGSGGTGGGTGGTVTSGPDNLTGTSAGELLDGGAGADSMAGGQGNDTYVVDNTGDVVTEAPGGGTDTVQAGVTYTLAANIEDLILSGTTAINGTGNADANSLIGNSAANRLDGAAGADTMTGGAGDDTYVVDNAGDTVAEDAASGADTVQASVTYTLGVNLETLVLTGAAVINGTGNGDANTISGNSAANLLDGGAGADAMSGGQGDDTYVVDNGGDTVTEDAASGADTVQASITYTLGANLETLVLTGAAVIDGTGNGDANTISGNSAANRLDGAAGADSMAGGAGDDTYVVDNAGDTVTEIAGAGSDTIIALVNYTLSANVENLVLSASAVPIASAGAILTATGNAAANHISGNASANLLDGGAGADSLAGGAGNDTYIVDNAGDVLTEIAGAGTDLVRSSVTYALGANVENLTLTGSAALKATGNALGNTIAGNAGANVITGGAGKDYMTGGAGKDVFDFNTIGETTKLARDVITDFTHLQDRIDLSTIDANGSLAGNGAFVFLATKGAAFTGVHGQLHYLASGANTIVEGDLNGDKVADFQIQLNGLKVLTAADFIL